MRRAALVLALAVLSPLLHAASTPPAFGPADAAPLSLDFSVNAKTTIPGATIASGHYTISVVEHLTDRVILRVADRHGKVKSIFLGTTTTALFANGRSGPILWTGKGETALRGFGFPGAPTVEFVYPKDQAVAIAKNNSEKVLAVDPASDGLSMIDNKLSSQDMQIVTLWALQSTRVGPDAGQANPDPQPTISAVRYQPQPPSAPAQVASEQTPPVARRHTIAVLPHTASQLPLVLLAAILALLGSAILRLRRSAAARV